MEIQSVEPGIKSLRIASDASPYLDRRVLPALEDAVRRLSGDPEVRAILVEGGRRYFSAGASREALLTSDPKSAVPTYVSQIPRLLLQLPVPSIAVMEGHALGGGLIIGLWCDLAVLAEESIYAANFMQLGFTPGMGSTAVLQDAVGGPLARTMLFTGRSYKGREIKAAGVPISHSILPRARVREEALALAREIAALPRESLLLLKQEISRRRERDLGDALEAERGMHALLFSRAETRMEILARYPAAD